MALGDTYAGYYNPDTEPGTGLGGFVGTSEPAFGNQWSGNHELAGILQGVATGGLSGSDPIGALLAGPDVGEYSIPFTPGATSSPFGTTSWEDGVLRMDPSEGMMGAISGLFGGGAQLLGTGIGNATRDFSQLRNEQLSLLRELSEPAEERAAASTASRLFSGGALGSTGGANQMRALQEAEQQADLQRQLQAIGLAQQQQQQGLQQAQLGSQLFGRGVQVSEPLFNQAQFGLDIGAGRVEGRARGGEITTMRQENAGLFGGGGAEMIGSALGSIFSDERLKTNIVDRDTGKITKEQAKSLRSVDFDMFGRRSSGVIAQDLEKAGLNDLIVEHPSGYKMVNYGELTARLVSTLKEVYADG